MRVIDMDARVLSKIRDDRFSREFALLMVKMSFIAPSEPPLLPAIRAELWRRNVVTLTRNLWGDSCVEIKISLGDFEGGRTVGADFIHWLDGYLNKNLSHFSMIDAFLGQRNPHMYAHSYPNTKKNI